MSGKTITKPERIRKSFGGEVKLDTNGKGTGQAIIATFNVKDKDGDVTLPGAFDIGAKVDLCQYGHQWSMLPWGVGTINADDEKAWIDFEAFLDTPQGEATHKTLVAQQKAGKPSEWSYGFDILDFEYSSEPSDSWEGKVRVLKTLFAFEASPVLRGAGVGTSTVAVKSEGGDVCCPSCGTKFTVEGEAKADECAECGMPTADCTCEPAKAKSEPCPDCEKEVGACTCSKDDAEKSADAAHIKQSVLNTLVASTVSRARALGFDTDTEIGAE